MVQVARGGRGAVRRAVVIPAVILCVLCFGGSLQTVHAAQADPVTAQPSVHSGGVSSPDSVSTPAWVTGDEGESGVHRESASSDRGRDTEDSRVGEYWTQDRMDAAVPLELAVPPSVIDTPSGPADSPGGSPGAVVVEPVPATASPGDPVRPEAVTRFPRTVGKVFFRSAADGRNYVCSASALNSGSKRLVATAGHCVHGGRGGTWHRDWMFVPEYRSGVKPDGYFTARTLRTFVDWINFGESGRGLASDVALVTTNSGSSGGLIVDRVGGNGLVVGGSREFTTDIFGYPVNLDRGERMWACTGTSGSRNADGYLFPSISGCRFGGGSSGGPWTYGYSNATGLGYLRSVTSFGPRTGTEFIAGPYFDARVRSLYNETSHD